MEQTPIESLTALQQRITKKQAGNLQIFQKEILEELKAIRQSLVSQSRGVSAVVQNVDGDKKDNLIAELQKQNRRLAYRITILARNLREAL